MPHRKISQLASAASAAAGQRLVLVSGGTNKQITWRTLSLQNAFYQEASARATATVAMVPSCDLMDLYVKAIADSSGGDGGTAINVGIGTDATYFGTITVSAKGIYRITEVSARNLQNVSGAVVAAAPTATAASIFIVGVGFVRR